MQAFYIILLGALVACSCSILGTFLLLRKMSMLADAISHAVLPGIVVAYLLTDNRANISMLLGAGCSGLLATYLIEWLNKKIKIQHDASIGIVFTWLFAIGVILISMFANKVDLDQDCVLYGEIAYVGLGTDQVPTQIWIMGGLLSLIIVAVWLNFTALKITSFDSGYAVSVGISAVFWHYFLMGMVSLTTVAAFDSVGAILVVSLFVIPAATAYLITHDLVRMILISCIVGCFGSVGGYYVASLMDSSIAACISTVCGFQFIIVFLAIVFKNKYQIAKSV